MVKKIFTIILSLIIIGCSNEPPQDIKDKVIYRAKIEGYICQKYTCKDFKITEYYDDELKSVDDANGITEKWHITVSYIAKIGDEWYSHTDNFLVKRKNGVLQLRK